MFLYNKVSYKNLEPSDVSFSGQNRDGPETIYCPEFESSRGLDMIYIKFWKFHQPFDVPTAYCLTHPLVRSHTIDRSYRKIVVSPESRFLFQ